MPWMHKKKTCKNECIQKIERIYHSLCAGSIFLKDLKRLVDHVPTTGQVLMQTLCVH